MQPIHKNLKGRTDKISSVPYGKTTVGTNSLETISEPLKLRLSSDQYDNRKSYLCTKSKYGAYE